VRQAKWHRKHLARLMSGALDERGAWTVEDEVEGQGIGREGGCGWRLMSGRRRGGSANPSITLHVPWHRKEKALSRRLNRPALGRRERGTKYFLQWQLWVISLEVHGERIRNRLVEVLFSEPGELAFAASPFLHKKRENQLYRFTQESGPKNRCLAHLLRFSPRIRSWELCQMDP
jgi:hypothetical protein